MEHQKAELQQKYEYLTEKAEVQFDQILEYEKELS